MSSISHNVVLQGILQVEKENFLLAGKIRILSISWFTEEEI